MGLNLHEQRGTRLPKEETGVGPEEGPIKRRLPLERLGDPPTRGQILFGSAGR